MFLSLISVIRRSKANEVYTAKILGGYIMHDELCKNCDMPMMKCNDLVECVFCQKEEEEKDEQVDTPLTKAKEEKEDDSDDIVEDPEPLKEVRSLFPIYNIYMCARRCAILSLTLICIQLKCKSHQLSQAEIIAKRCRDMKSKGDGDIEAETELLNMIGTLDMVSMATDDNCTHTIYTRHIPVANNAAS